MIAYSFFFHMVHWSFILGQEWLLSNHFCKACQNCLHPSFAIVHKAVRAHLLLLCCESPPQCYHAAQTTPIWTKPIWYVLQKIIAVQPSMAKYEWTMYQIKVDYLRYHVLESVLLYLFSILRNFESNRGFFLRNSIELILINLEEK